MAIIKYEVFVKVCIILLQHSVSNHKYKHKTIRASNVIDNIITYYKMLLQTFKLLKYKHYNLF
jgi:hypothetical protein